MDDNERRRYEMLVRVRQFGTDNAGDFPGGSVGDTQFTVVGDSVDGVESEAGKQQAGFGEAAQQYEVKGTARENLREQMSDISRTARSMEYAFDGISNKFRMPRNRNDADLLNKGRAFATEAVPYNTDFKDYGLPGSFIADLTAACDAFEATFSTTASATAEHVAATAQTGETIRLGMVAVRILDGVVKNKYANDVGKLAAWISASHVEKAPKKKEPTPPTPPTP
ncbi:MAG: hypothetical protein WBC19_15330 [Pyrinomonadaceae bacterium]|nr:hypothetical protein [Chloracidobacterium sp.]